MESSVRIGARMSREFDLKLICIRILVESSVWIGTTMSREFDIKHICRYTSGE